MKPEWRGKYKKWAEREIKIRNKKTQGAWRGVNTEKGGR